MISTLAFNAMLTSAKVNEIIDAVNNLGLIARKLSDETVTSSTALQDDDDLQLQLEASSVYRFRMYLRVNATSASDFKAKFSLPSGAVLTAVVDTVVVAGSAFTLVDIDETTTFTSEGAGARRPVVIDGVIVTSSTPGAAKLQWAQNASGSPGTQVQAGSFFWAVKAA